MYRYVDTSGIWEAGFRQMAFGVRIRVGKQGCGFCALEYCAGADMIFAAILLDAVIKILKPMPAYVTERQLQDIFPIYKTKPINLDPCWEIIKEMAESINEDNYMFYRLGFNTKDGSFAEKYCVAHPTNT